MKYFYCDSCFIFTLYQETFFEQLSQYKDQFFISETQLGKEILYPEELPNIVRKTITVVQEREEIAEKAKGLMALYHTLSSFDCLCMAFCLLDGYCLITDDKALIKKCDVHQIQTVTSEAIIETFIKKK